MRSWGRGRALHRWAHLWLDLGRAATISVFLHATCSPRTFGWRDCIDLFLP